MAFVIGVSCTGAQIGTVGPQRSDQPCEFSNDSPNHLPVDCSGSNFGLLLRAVPGGLPKGERAINSYFASKRNSRLLYTMAGFLYWNRKPELQRPENGIKIKSTRNLKRCFWPPGVQSRYPHRCGGKIQIITVNCEVIHCRRILQSCLQFPTPFFQFWLSQS